MIKWIACILSMSLASMALADSAVFTVKRGDKEQKLLGEVVFVDTDYGLLITPKLEGLPAGGHGFHFHQHPDCGDHGNMAGAHYDPFNTNTHQGPYGQGHLGDLPVLYVNADGKATTPILAPRLKVKDILGLALMIHDGGDTYSDIPPLGGGGARIACGILNPVN